MLYKGDVDMHSIRASCCGLHQVKVVDVGVISVCLHFDLGAKGVL